jgi:hypothetical protein
MGKKKRFKSRFLHGKKANSGHPAYIYAKDGDSFKYIGITHADITDNVKNIKLEKNPNPMDMSDSYIRPKHETDKTVKFGSRYPHWNFSENDKGKVKSVIKKDNDKKR